MNYYVISQINLGEEMTRQQAEDYAKTMARKHPAATYLVVQSVGRTKHEIEFEWDNSCETLSDHKIYQHGNGLTMDCTNSDTPSDDMDGYRLLDIGEIIQDGDEYNWEEDGGWQKSVSVGKKVIWLEVGSYRRKIK